MAELAERIRRHFLWLLLPTYLVAYLLPGPGVYAAKLSWSQGLPEAAAIRLPMLLVAVLLLNAALEVNVDELRSVLTRTRDLLISLAAVWIAPAVVVVTAGLLFAMTDLFATTEGATGGGGLLLGMILVAAMPVANSSAGWTQQSGGALAWALALVVLSILLSSVVTPAMIRLLGMSLSAAEVDSVEEVVHKFSGVAFIVWVLAPTLLGLAIRRLAGEERVRAIRPLLHLSTSAAILGLNYLNGSLVLPEIFPQPDAALLIAAVCGAVAICLVGLLAAQLLTHLLRCDARDRLALKFALSMKHTGLALGLASTVLADHPDAILLIILTTPIQHMIAALVSKRYGMEVDQ